MGAGCSLTCIRSRSRKWTAASVVFLPDTRRRLEPPGLPAAFHLFYIRLGVSRLDRPGALC
jgi:hypothetical protein